jgi:hypothetical protein
MMSILTPAKRNKLLNGNWNRLFAGHTGLISPQKPPSIACTARRNNRRLPPQLARDRPAPGEYRTGLRRLTFPTIFNKMLGVIHAR